MIALERHLSSQTVFSNLPSISVAILLHILLFDVLYTVWQFTDYIRCSFTHAMYGKMTFLLLYAIQYKLLVSFCSGITAHACVQTD